MGEKHSPAPGKSDATVCSVMAPAAAKPHVTATLHHLRLYLPRFETQYVNLRLTEASETHYECILTWPRLVTKSGLPDSECYRFPFRGHLDDQDEAGEECSASLRSISASVLELRTSI